jgi:hypothetical protein
MKMIVGIKEKFIPKDPGVITWINRNLCNVGWKDSTYILSGVDEDVTRAIEVIQDYAKLVA